MKPRQRPAFGMMMHWFADIYGGGTLVEVGAKIGGKVQFNIQLAEKDPLQGFANACAIRMSYCLHQCGVQIVPGPWRTSSGADGRKYIYKVNDLLKFLRFQFGAPEHVVSKKPQPKDFKGEQGILAFGVPFDDATGHATLWDGIATAMTCADHCYFPIANEASLWVLQ